MVIYFASFATNLHPGKLISYNFSASVDKLGFSRCTRPHYSIEENQDVFQWACHLGSTLEQPPSRIFEPDGRDKLPCNFVETHLFSLWKTLYVLMELSSVGRLPSIELHSDLALEEDVRPHFVVHSKRCGIIVEVKLNLFDEREGIRQIESQKYFSKYEDFLKNVFCTKLEKWQKTSKWGVGLNVYVNEEEKTVVTCSVVQKYDNRS